MSDDIGGYDIEEPLDRQTSDSEIQADVSFEQQTNNFSSNSTTPSRDWNKEFQQLLSDVAPFDETGASHSLSEQEILRTTKLRRLCNEFADEATRVAVQIINELFLPNIRRSIRAVTDLMGGVAGGEKFCHSGIFFKLSRDWKGIYGSDSHAIKAAELELKGTMALLDCRISGLHFPLMALIRYRGYAVVAQSILPIDSASLKYGSSDAGKSFKNDDFVLSSKMAAACKILNLKPHTVWSRNRSASTLLHGPADIEGHLGSDGLYYVVDTARLFPPSAPSSVKRRSHLYALLRPERVKLNPVPLSSDAFSPFGGADNVIHDAEVVAATKLLLNEIIPAFAKSLDKRYVDSQKGSGTEDDLLSIEEIISLGAEMHMHGINCRYLLRVYSHLSTSECKRLVLTEACARAAKHLLEETWRTMESSDEMPYLQRACEFFHVLANTTADSELYWKSPLYDELLQRFELEGTSSVLDPHCDLRSLIHMGLFLFRTSMLLGLSFDLDVLLGHLREKESPMFTLKIWLGPNALVFASINARTKYLHRISFEEGTALCRIALTKTDAAERRRLFSMANERFKECLATKPNDYRALFNWAFALSQQALVSTDETQSRGLWNEMGDKFAKALILHPKDWRALAKWGTSLCLRSRSLTGQDEIDVLRLASEKLNMAVSFLPWPHFKTIFNAGNADLSLARAMDHQAVYSRDIVAEALTRAVQLLNKAILMEPSSADALRNNAVRSFYFAIPMLARAVDSMEKQNDLYERAFSLYERALETDSSSAEVLYSYGNARLRRALVQRETNRTALDCVMSVNSAAELYCRSLRLSPDFQDAFVNFGVSMALLFKWCKNLSTFLRLHDLVRCFLEHATLLAPRLSSRELPSIIASCKHIIRLMPGLSPGARDILDTVSNATNKQSQAPPLSILRPTNNIRTLHPNFSASSIHLLNNRHSETETVALPIVGSPNGLISGVQVREVQVDWKNRVIFSFDADTQICENSLQIVNTILGTCRSGVVFLATYRGREYAVKSVSKTQMSKLTSRPLVVFEHPLFVPLRYVFQSDTKIWFLFDRVSGPRFDEFVVQARADISSEILRFYIAELISAAAVIVNAGLLYPDFKGSNILLGDDCHIKFLTYANDCSLGSHHSSDGPTSTLWKKLGIYLTNLLKHLKPILHGASSASTLVHLLAETELSDFRSIKHHPFFSGVKWRRVGSFVPPITAECVKRFSVGENRVDHGIAATLVAPSAPNQLEGYTMHFGISPSIM